MPPQPLSKPLCLVSACLLGLCTRYDGKNKTNKACLHVLKHYQYIPICPEQLGGLPTPRPPAMLMGGDGHAVLDGRARVLNPTVATSAPPLYRARTWCVPLPACKIFIWPCSNQAAHPVVVRQGPGYAPPCSNAQASRCRNFNAPQPVAFPFDSTCLSNRNTRIRTMPISYSRYKGIPIRPILTASGVGVNTAAKIAMANMA